MRFCSVPALFALAASLSFAQTAPLPYNPTSAAYSRAVDRLVMITGSDSALHVYDPVTRNDAAVPLAKAPLSLSVSPDGTHAAIGHDGLISYVNLASLTVEKQFPVPVSASIMVLASDYVYVLPSISIQLATGEVTMRQGATNTAYSAVLDAPGKAIYFSDTDPTLKKIDISGGPLAADVTNVSNPALRCLTNNAPSDSFSYAPYTITCGEVLNALNDPGVGGINIVPIGSSLDVSPDKKQIAFVLQELTPRYSSGKYIRTDADQNKIDLISSDRYTLQGQFLLPDFQSGGQRYQAFGRWVFFNSAGAALYVVMNATVGSTVQAAVQTIPLMEPVACGAGFAQSGSGAISYTGATYGVSVTADPSCTYIAHSNADWIQIADPTLRSGNATLAFTVGPNLGAARSGTITVGTQTYTVQQDAAPATLPAQLPLSFNVVDAGYSRALDRLVAVSANPNGLHIINPFTHAEQVVALPGPPGVDYRVALDTVLPSTSAPSTLSVRPDGLVAAVAHYGFASLVDLQTGTLIKTVPIGYQANRIVLGSNGYLYSLYGARFVYSTEIATGILSVTTGKDGGGPMPKLSPSGNRLLVFGYGYADSRVAFDLKDGIAKLLQLPDAPNFVPSSVNEWFDETGTQLITANGTAYGYSESAPNDFTYLGAVSDLDILRSALGSYPNSQVIQSADHSAKQKLIAAIPGAINSGSAISGVVQLFRDDNYQYVNQLDIPPFSAGSQNLPIYGRWVFWDKQASNLIVISLIDTGGNPGPRYGISVLPVTTGTGDCKVTFNPAEINASALSNNISVTVSFSSACPWTIDSAPSWAQVSYNSGPVTSFPAAQFPTLSAQLRIVIPEITDGNARSGSLVINGQTLTIRQAGLSTTPILTPGTQFFTRWSDFSSAHVAILPGTPWKPVASTSWIHVDAAQVTGTGTFGYSVEFNPGSLRTGTISVGDQSFSIVQGSGLVPTSTGLTFIPITPCRAVDTRSDSGLSGAFGAPIMAAGSSREFPLPSSRCGIPSTAQAYAVNVTVVPDGPLGFLTLWPAGQERPIASTLNAYDGQITANAAIVPAGANGSIVGYVTDRTHVVIDINGYFDSQPNQGLSFSPAQPCRVADTRLAAGPFGGPTMAGQTTRDFAVPNSACGVPATAQAYSTNVTVVPTEPLYYLTAWPTGKSQPYVSTLNSLNGSIVANAAILPAGTNGSVSVAVTHKTDVILDVNGYFAPPSSTGLKFYPITPCRALDTRDPAYGRSMAAPSSTLGISLIGYQGGVCDIPTNAKAFSVNVTVDPHGHPLGFLRLRPSGGTVPEVSTLNSPSGKVVANAAIVPGDSGGYIIIDVTDPTDVIIDVNGFFAP